MKFPISVFALAALLTASLPAASPSVTVPLPNLKIGSKSAVPNIDLRNYFGANPVVRFSTVSGTINVEMLPDSAPGTVNNFLTYVGANSFANSFIHRSDKPLGVIQGGSFFSNANAQLFYVPTRSLSNCTTTTGSTTVTCQSTLPASVGMILSGTPFSANAVVTAITSATTVTISSPALSTTRGGTFALTLPLETSDTLANSPGTIAMARTTDPNSATNGWFFNTSASTTSLPPASSNGYAVFGRVLKPADMSVVDAIAALPVPTVSVVVNNSTTTNTVVGVASVPPELKVGVVLLGSTIGAIGPGNFIFLNSNANQTITTPTTITVSRFADPLTQLPVVGTLGANLTFANLAVVSSVTRVSPFPANAADTAALINFTILQNTNPSVLTASINGSTLSLSKPASVGSTVISIAATDSHGMAVQSTFTVTVSPETSLRDINGDGLNDLVFQNSFGQIATWFLKGDGQTIDFATGSGQIGSRRLYSGGLGDFRVVGVGDINGDGIPDLVFQNTSGQIAAWFLKGDGNAIDFATGAGLAPVEHKLLYPFGLGDFRVVGVGDINGDGIPDLIFQNSVGQISAWFLKGDGNAIDFSTGAGLAPARNRRLFYGGLGDFRVVGVGDINGDGIPDLVFQNSAGQISAWFLSGDGNTIDFASGSGLAAAKNRRLFSSSVGDFRVVAVRDINGDGIPDLIFQDTFGRLAAWFLKGDGAAIDFATGAGLAPAKSRRIFPTPLGDWRAR